MSETVPAYKNFLIEGRGGSVPPVVRNFNGLSLTDEVNMKKKETI